ncbi:MAG: AI-2E family transporter [Legionellales bacterium RIFCSPHIGHO2_12_FULL_35_11]|nr:MAG: AI-2E family transporter [Legionellales bacterium RIFCSPHIGHO2_12_FULL_35_11]
MTSNHRELISIGLTILIVAMSLFIIHRFVPSLVWAAIISMSTYPLYQKWRKIFRGWDNVASLLFTMILVFILILPLSWFITILVKEFQFFLNYLHQINSAGGAAPSFIQELPIIGKDLETYWDAHIGQPGSVKGFLSNMHLPLTPTSNYIKLVGGHLVHRSVQVGFTLLSLFFLYRDGDILAKEINKIGSYCLGKRWFRYAEKLPKALRATVNGTIVVGVGVGVLMGLCYGLIGFPAPTLMGFVTAFAAMIPFVVPIAFGIVALILVFNGSMMAAVIVVISGTIIMFIADHFIKPVLIGGAIKLPFLAVLFGILGGVETLGLLGLFVGPIIMVLFVTLWYEGQGPEAIELADMKE